MHFFLIFFAFILYSGINLAETPKKVKIAQFSSGILENWNNKSFSGTTKYELIQMANMTVLKASSHASASGLFKKQRINLLKTPYINWRWRIDNKLKAIDDHSKVGDDYSARIYIIVSGGWAFWKTKAINYVWAAYSDKGTIWPNAFAGDSAMMLAIRSAEDKTQTWYREKRNVLQDLKKMFGKEIHFIDAVAVMTDTDNTKADAVAYYGDIYFSSK